MKNYWHPHLRQVYELLPTHMLPCAIPFESQVFFSCHEAKEKGFGSQNKCRINNTTFQLEELQHCHEWKGRKQQGEGMCNEFFCLSQMNSKWKRGHKNLDQRLNSFMHSFIHSFIEMILVHFFAFANMTQSFSCEKYKSNNTMNILWALIIRLTY